MKNTTMRKLAGIAAIVTLASCMMAPMGMTAFAVEPTTYTITINDNGESTAADHTFDAYQIFSGELSKDENDNTVLSNIEWGNGVNSAALVTALQADATIGAYEKIDALTDESTAYDVSVAMADITGTDVDILATIINNNLATKAASSTDGAISGLTAGYYFVKDVTEEVAEGDAKSKFILEVAEDVDVTIKSATVTFEKKVIDTNDSVADSTTGLQDSADHDIGDAVSFQLKGTVSEKYADYTVYQYAFHDTESAGLTFNSDSVVVKVDGNVITEGYEVVTSPTDGCTFEIVFEDLKDIASVGANSVITVDYTSTLNEGAVIGKEGNPNEAYLEYSNNPNDKTGAETGSTTEDVVIVFTYQGVVNKVDESGNALTGAEFTLEKYNAETEKWDSLTVVKNEAGTTFTFKGLDDGRYRVTETETPVGYNSIDPIYFTVTAEHDVESETPALTALNATQTQADIEAGTVAAFNVTLDNADAQFSTDIENKAGSTLPSTGGIGTTLFYVIGGTMAAGAGVYLISKKRMNNK